MSSTTAVATLLGGPLVGGVVHQGEQQKEAAKKAERSQATAQRLATSRAAAELRTQDQERRRLNRRKPNVAGLLAEERRSSLTGAGATTLTGASGVGRERLTLGRSSLLGTS